MANQYIITKDVVIVKRALTKLKNTNNVVRRGAIGIILIRIFNIPALQ
jgi:hypothetical protein